MIGNGGAFVTAGQLESRLGAYGELGELFIQESDAYSVAFPATTPTVVKPMTEGPAKGSVVLDGVNGTLTFNKAGIYRGAFNISFALDGPAIAKGSIYINGIKSGKSAFTRTISNLNDFGNAGFGSIVEIEVVNLPVVVDFRIELSAARILLIQTLDINIAGIS